MVRLPDGIVRVWLSARVPNMAWVVLGRRVWMRCFAKGACPWVVTLYVFVYYDSLHLVDALHWPMCLAATWMSITLWSRTRWTRMKSIVDAWGSLRHRAFLRWASTWMRTRWTRWWPWGR